MKKLIVVLVLAACVMPLFAFNSVIGVGASDVVEYRGNPAKFSTDGISFGVDVYARFWNFRAGATVLRQLHPDKTAHGRFALGFAFDIDNGVRFMPSVEIPWFIRDGKFWFAEAEGILEQLKKDTLCVRLDVEMPVNYMTFGLSLGLDTGLAVSGSQLPPDKTMLDNLMIGVKAGVTLY